MKNLMEVNKMMNINYDANCVTEDDAIRVIVETLRNGHIENEHIVRDEFEVITGVTQEGWEIMKNIW